ncbi:antitoxin PHD [Escherichia coli]|uniref:antitoxin PHD n=1 Tax=Escherichia coli TaxID=562 RepID=UPI000DA44ACF|nr:antitoxin PHD [Escherichia coli]MCZ8863427.1 antitoxin PHD [Escherichia albertii]MCT7456419.1 antitoxin PHD [Escherichia coli]MDD8942967.1 antitoxin PHD [Escherichia coli]MDM5002887.1 antitoxin PHD [Escherichia coli]MDM5025842.1 antitoxin PHD [Escherichia coli]
MPTKAELQARVEILEKENASLKGMLARAERELSGKLLPEELPPADIPDRVSWWMKYFRAPWEAFWCYDHRGWCDEIVAKRTKSSAVVDVHNAFAPKVSL